MSGRTKGRVEIAYAEKKFDGWECFVHAMDTPHGEKLPAIAIGIDKKQATANAALIAEAFNVAYETGRTPKQLADERAELVEAIEKVMQKHDDYARRCNFSKCGCDYCEPIRAVLAKVKGPVQS